MIRPEMLCPSWPQKPLGEAVEFLDHLRRPITARDRVSGPYPYYGANGQQDSVADFIFDEPLILMAEDGGYFGDPDRTIAYRVDGKCWVNNHAHVLRPKDGVDIGFLCRQLEKYDVTRFINGATRQKLNKSSASEIPIILPSLAEQKRIAVILDKADAIRRKRRQAIQHADELLRSVFLDMFGDPVYNPRNWKINKIEEIGIVQGGLQLTPKRKSYPIELPYLRVANVFRNKLDLREIKTIKITEAELSRALLKNEDILIVEEHGNRTELGRSAIWDGSIKQCTHQNHLIRLRIDKKGALPKFVFTFLNSSGGKRQLFKYGKTTSGLNTISTSNVKETEIFLPPLELQKRFVDIINKIEKLKNAFMIINDRQNILLKSLSQRAFRGEL